jgi:uncharacterized protein YycO
MLVTIWKWFSLKVISKIDWSFIKAFINRGIYWDLTIDDWRRVETLLIKDHYVILIRRKTHLTTYLIWLSGLIKMGKGSYWSHGLLNIESEKFIEATSSGTHFSTFSQVFDCDSVCLLRPKGFTTEDWTAAIDKALADIGKPYDTLFDPNQEASLSCVELVRNALQAAPDYAKDFPKFEAMIKKYGAVIPQMIYDDGEFERMLEIRH